MRRELIGHGGLPAVLPCSRNKFSKNGNFLVLKTMGEKSCLSFPLSHLVSFESILSARDSPFDLACAFFSFVLLAYALLFRSIVDGDRFLRCSERF